MNINFEHYKVFYYVAKNKSITHAAEALYISQPAVSKSIKQLEKEVGCDLFYRNQRGMRLTPEGEALYKHVSKGFEQFTMGEKKIRDMMNLNGGVIRLCTSEVIARFTLLPYLEHFHSRYPEIRIMMKNGSTPETLSALKEEAIDIGIVSSPVNIRGDVQIIPIHDVQDIFIAGNQFRDSLEGSVISLEEMTKYPLICTDRNTTSRHFIEGFFVKKGLTIDPAFELGSMEMVLPYTEHNLGIGIVISRYAEKMIEQKRIFEVKTDQKIPKRSTCLITRKKGYLSKAAEAFLELVREEIHNEKL